MRYKKKMKKSIAKPAVALNTREGRLSLGRQKDEVIFPVAPLLAKMPKSYRAFLINLKKRVQQERLRVVLASNAALINLYWDMGRVFLKNKRKKAGAQE